MNPGTGNSFCGLYFRSGELGSSQTGRYIHRHPKRGTQIRDKEALVAQDEVSSLHTCKDTTLLCYYFVGSWTWIQDTNKGNNSIWWNTNEGFKSVPMFVWRISFFLCAQLWWDGNIYLCIIQNYSGISKCSKTCRITARFCSLLGIFCIIPSKGNLCITWIKVKTILWMAASTTPNIVLNTNNGKLSLSFISVHRSWFSIDTFSTFQPR